ncbi:nucleotide exchange factor GrpE [Ignatzschineria sp. RMDPL8A]|uniref:nucleotide exchange factor GrpE n=1 Tax=Ignatzschineria sp. RMDPL8A TaxID=2999236 RepID=UPI0024466DEA|nr:nucleotide exchange factor GrpE [Ignatzschineria sp. RMDPL8A]MDG9730161.1 nucleotide exchange factor GrpE [Ignatzschineria sp. RMDPL8A]
MSDTKNEMDVELENDALDAEATDEVVEGEESELTLEELTAAYEAAQAEKEKLYNQYLLAAADVKNIKRRAEIDVANAHKYALDKFVKELLPILDAMELELNALQKSENDEVKQFITGSELTYKMLLNACEKFGVVQINPTGEKLDPERHQAITMQKNREFESGHVIQVVQKGYLLNERVVRAAQVIVAE